jgi:hypothetical protein
MFAKIKQFLGIGGISVSLNAPGSFTKDSHSYTGEILLKAKSDQHVQSIQIRMKQVTETEQGETKNRKEYIIGEEKLNMAFDMKTGEEKQIPFSVSFSRRTTGNDDLAERGGALGAMGKLGRFVQAEKHYYTVVASVDVKDTGLDPVAVKSLNLA